ncbi:hypothetical protein [Variovorax sp. CAN15]|uniref:hypothetical protein n=1 Tax=Variovorax sp. CAN15 TaxID=3046727 RepID=UPI0026470876|nr:hypothetical protein [Variovorax sp. CAN15]
MPVDRITLWTEVPRMRAGVSIHAPNRLRRSFEAVPSQGSVAVMDGLDRFGRFVSRVFDAAHPVQPGTWKSEGEGNAWTKQTFLHGC